MPYLMDRLGLALCFSLCCLTIAGCQDGPSDEYQSFDAIRESDGSGDDTVVDARSAGPQVEDEPSAADIVEDRSQPGLVNSSEDDPPSTKDPFQPKQQFDNSADDATVAGEPAQVIMPQSDDEPITPELASEGDGGLPEDLPPSDPDLTAMVDVPAEQREIKLLIPEKSFTTEGDAGALRVSYDDVNLLDVLNMDPVPVDAETYFPGWLAGLEGQRIRIRGFMYPAFQSTGLRTFVLVRDNQECCFGPGAKIYDHIQVTMRDGVTTDYIQGRAFDVEGVFHILPEADEDELYQLFLLEDSLVLDQ